MKKLISLALATWVALAVQALAQTPLILKPPTPAAGDGFGTAVVAFGNDILVGAPGDDSLATDAGAVYLFEGGTGKLLRAFLNPLPDGGDNFGSAIAVSGSTVVIGAPGEDTEVTNAGAAYLFDGNTGALLDVLSNPNPVDDDRFGSSVAIGGNTIIIGAPFVDAQSPDAGAVYLFDLGSRQLQRIIPLPDIDDFARFGTAVAAVGNGFAVGTPSDGDARIASFGSVYFYDDVSDQQPLYIPNPLFQNSSNRQDSLRANNNGFGQSVAAFGNNLLAGAPFNPDFAAAYLVNSATGNLIQTYPSPNPGVDDRFGFSLAVAGKNVFVSAPGNGDNINGAVYVFAIGSGNRLRAFPNQTTVPADRFGFAVAVAGNDTLISAPGASNGTGVVYAFGEAVTCQLTLLSPRGGSQTCEDSIQVMARVEITGGVQPFNRVGNVNGTTANFAGDTLFATIPLTLGLNTIIARSTITDFAGAQTVCTDTTTMTRFAEIHNVVINEILYDPNYDDFGTERIELKNVGDDTTKLDGFALWIRHEDLDTHWLFPDGASIAPGGLLTIHWLKDGIEDRGNIFTGLPFDDDSFEENQEQDNFWGNNSTDSGNMALGGAGDANDVSFAIALFQQIRREDIAEFREACRMVDFVQIGGSIPAIDTLADQAGLWSAGEFLDFIPQGHSYEFDTTASPPILSNPGNFTDQSSPSIGFKNVLAPPPAQHLLIPEVCVRPAFGEFVEIHNPTPASINLSNYYLTDNVNLRDNTYTLLAKGPGALNVQAGEFLVKFPDGAQIGPGEYQTVAFRATDFRKRYGQSVNPTYEINSSDLNVPDMIALGLGASPIGFADAEEAIVLLRWNGASDLVEEVDYVAWSSPFVNKTGLDIDGVDGDLTSSYYDNETPDFLQKPAAGQVHALLKSWQRRPRPREFGELPAGGNGISGHDETSEDLALAFREATPTPNRRAEGLDLVYVDSLIVEISANGEPNGEVNPGERISLSVRLKNVGSENTGPLFSVLRTSERLITIGPDSVATFPNIAPGDSVFSNDTYEFAAADTILPHQLFFQLFVVQKSPETEQGLAKTSSNIPNTTIVPFVLSGNNVSLRMINIVPTLMIQAADTVLQISHQLMHTLTSGATANPVVGMIKSFDNQLIDASQTSLPQANSYGPLAPSGISAIRGFNFVTKVPFKGHETPQIVFKFTWVEGIGGQAGIVTRNLTFTWLPLTSFRIEGRARTIDAVDIANATVKLKNANTTQTAVTAINGSYLFPTVSDTGAYEISVTRSGIPMDAIDSNDVTAAGNPSVLNVYERIAANVAGPGMVIDDIVDPLDVNEIQAKLTSLCLPFSRLGKHWTFIDAHKVIPLEQFFEAPDKIQIILKNYHFNQLNFVGILYGDVQGNVNPANANITTGCPSPVSISGKVTYFQTDAVDMDNGNGVLVPNTLLTLDGGSFAQVTTPATGPTTGQYQFSNIPAGFKYTVTPSKTGEIGTAINAQDTTLLGMYLGPPVTNILNPWQLLAADIDQDGDVDQQDRTKLRNYVDPPAGVVVDVGQAGRWRFKTPDRSSFQRIYNLLNVNQEMQNFVAVLIGDINGDWTHPAGAAAAANAKFVQYPFLQDIEVIPGDTFHLPLRVEPEQKIVSVQFDLVFDESKVEFIGIAPSKALKNYRLDYKQAPERLTASLTGAHSARSASEVFHVSFRAVGQVGESSLLELNRFSVNDGPLMQATATIKLVNKAPQHFFLSPNYPNPFNPTTTIEYGLPREEHVLLQIFNVLGQVVFTAVDKKQEAGYYRLQWGGSDHNGHLLPSGVYIMRLKAGKFSQTRKLALLK